MTKENYSMIGRFALVLTAFLSGTLAEPRTSAAGPTPVLTAGSDTVHVGDVFAIPISIANTAGLTSFQFDLAFDPTIITALSFTDSGTDFDLAASSGGGFLTGITGFIDNTTGLLSGIAGSISGLITGTGLSPRRHRFSSLGTRDLPARPVERLPDRQRCAAVLGEW